MGIGRGLIDDVDDYDDGLAEDLLSGPGKLCQALSIGPELSGQMVGDELAVAPGEPIWRTSPDRVAATPRIGLNPDTCGEAVEWSWRYIVDDSPWTSCRAG